MLFYIRQTFPRGTSMSQCSMRRLSALLHRPSAFTVSKFSTGRPCGQHPGPAAPTTESPSIPAFDPKLPAVNIPKPDGTLVRQNICPTPKANREKLSKGLEGLLGHDVTPPSDQSFASKRWMLDERGDAIHRHLSFESPQDAARFRAALLAVCDEMDHHPHITGDAALTITCTTHNPRGLSMRDVRLARTVDELATRSRAQCATTVSEADTASQREQRRVNRQAIDAALEKQTGACFTSKKVAANDSG